MFDVNQDVKIINDRNGDTTKTRADIDRIEIYELDSNNGNKVKHMEYKNKDGEIAKSHNFKKQGVYMIYYYFKEGVTDMSYMFHECICLTSLDFSKFNTKMVINMSCMFSWCSALTSLNISNFNTEKVTNMYGMFYGCSSLTTLNLNSFNTNIVTDMSRMFYGCFLLTVLKISNFNIGSGIKKDDLFHCCRELKYVITNDECIKECLASNNKVKVLDPNEGEENIEIVGNSDNLKGDSQTQSKSNCWCCPCCKNR